MLTADLHCALLGSEPPLVSAGMLWVEDDLLVASRRSISVGDVIDGQVLAAAPDLQQGLRLLDPDARAVMNAFLPDRVDRTAIRGPVAITATVTSIRAISCSHRIGNGGVCTPDYRRLLSDEVRSTAEPLPARSVWPPSGHPVLIGFLLDVDRFGGLGG